MGAPVTSSSRRGRGKVGGAPAAHAAATDGGDGVRSGATDAASGGSIGLCAVGDPPILASLPDWGEPTAGSVAGAWAAPPPSSGGWPMARAKSNPSVAPPLVHSSTVASVSKTCLATLRRILSSAMRQRKPNIPRRCSSLRTRPAACSCPCTEIRLTHWRSSLNVSTTFCPSRSASDGTPSNSASCMSRTSRRNATGVPRPCANN